MGGGTERLSAEVISLNKRLLELAGKLSEQDRRKVALKMNEVLTQISAPEITDEEVFTEIIRVLQGFVDFLTDTDEKSH
jgi:hypothetical protein